MTESSAMCPVCMTVEGAKENCADQDPIEQGVLAGWVAATLVPRIEGATFCVRHERIISVAVAALDEMVRRRDLSVTT